MYIRRYKNLNDLWLPWNPRMVLIGANGVGKTNLLECCALLMGTAETKRLAARRIPDDLDLDISVVLRGDRLAFPIDALRALKEANHYPTVDTYVAVQQDDQWLRALGAQDGETLTETMTSTTRRIGADAATVDLLSRSVGDAIVRYRLLSDSQGRHSIRTLVTSEKPTLIAVPADNTPLPEPLQPLLKQWRAANPRGHDPYSDLLILPNRGNAPVDLQWLPHLRTDNEIATDFTNAIYDEAYSLGVLTWPETGQYVNEEGFESTLVGMIEDTTDISDKPDTVEWVVGLAEETAQHQLALTLPGLPPVTLTRTAAPVRIEGGPDLLALVDHDRTDNAAGDGGAECLVAVTVATPGSDSPLGQIDEANVAAPARLGAAGRSLVETLSAGERRWFDEAMHSAAMTIRARGRLAAADANRLNEVWQGEYSIDRDRLVSIIEDAWLEAGCWSPAAISRVLRELAEPMQQVPPSTQLPGMLNALRVVESEDYNPEHRQEMRETLAPFLWSAVASINPPHVKVRVFDEPEAHLHSGAVARVGKALDAFAGEADILVASHHPRFLYWPGWTPYHLRRSVKTGHVTVGTYDPAQRNRRIQVAEDLGLTHPETLAGARALLLVEGEHDKLVLSTPSFEQALATAGVITLPIRGVNELPSAALLEVLLELAPDTIGVMVDNGAGRPGQEPTPEQKLVTGFHNTATQRGLDVVDVELDRPDITAYLNPQAVADLHHMPLFGWGPIVQQFRASNRTNFKVWLWDTHRIDLRTTSRIQNVLAAMRDQSLPFEADLVRAINSFAARMAD